MTRLWTAGEPIVVEPDTSAAPWAFLWREQLHHVSTIAQRWRIDEGWWRWRVWREYFKLTTDTGLLVVLYHDLLSGRWYLQRLYD